MTQRSIRAAQLLVGLVVTGAFLWVVVRTLDWATVGTVLAGADVGWLIIGLAMLSAGYLCRIVRWWLMLRPSSPGLDVQSCAGPLLASVALNNVLPFRAGDVVRVFGFRRELSMSAARVLSTVLIERLLDLMALLTVFVVTLAWAETSGLPVLLVPAATVITGLCLMMIICVMIVPRPLERWAAAWLIATPGRFGTLRGRLGDVSRDFLASLTQLGSSRVVASLLGLSLVGWIFEGAMFAAVAKALTPGIGLGAWFALATGTLGTLLPSTPGYVGTFDYLTMLGLTAYAMAPETAALVALTIHAMLWVPLTAVGLAWLSWSKIRVASSIPAPNSAELST